ncbi:MAG: hypothetical protein AAFQ82_14155, partial [Myxococcota bacterium]
MNVTKKLNVDLDAPPERRWDVLFDYRESANELLDQYLADLGAAEDFSAMLEPYLESYVSAPLLAELSGLARTLGRSLPEVAL